MRDTGSSFPSGEVPYRATGEAGEDQTSSARRARMLVSALHTVAGSLIPAGTTHHGDRGPVVVLFCVVKEPA